MLRTLHRLHVVPPSLDTTYPIAIGAGIEQFGLQAPTASGASFITHPFQSRSLIASGGDPLRIVTMLNPRYELAVWTPQGKLERLVRTRARRRAMTDAERTYAVDWMLAREALTAADTIRVRPRLAEVPIPDSLPAGLDLVVADDGHILLAREGASPGATPRYDVFDARGVLLGALDLPVATYIRQVGADFVVVSTFDENDRQIIAVHRLVRPASARP